LVIGAWYDQAVSIAATSCGGGGHDGLQLRHLTLASDEYLALFR
jgi:hypothetical protein